MDDITKQRHAVKQMINHYASLTPSHGNIQLDTVFDEESDRYALMQVGWDRTKRISGNIIYITLRDSKVWIEYDGIERGITDDLVAAGISKEQIICAWLSK